jgi:iron complex transport system substrate-binding protein
LRRQLPPFLILATLVAGSACQPDSPARAPATAAIALTDNTGHGVELARPANRVISLVPARTDLILALGAADRLVARTVFDDDARLAALPSIGDALSPSVEWLAAQRPDLVIAWPDAGSRSVVSRLAALGVPTYTSRVETLAELRRTIGEIGTLLGLETEAAAVRSDIDAALAAVRAAVAGRARPRVLYLIGLDPPVAAGPRTFVQEVIDAAGGANLMADAPMRWPQVSLEHLLARGADVLILASERADADLLSDLRARPGWRDLEPVRRGRVHVVDADLFNRPGPTLVYAAASLAEILHPGALAEMNASDLLNRRFSRGGRAAGR